MHGKDYFTVVERLDMLIADVGKDGYSLKTDVKYESGIVIVRAVLILYDKGANDIETLEGSSRCYTGHALGELGKPKTLEATETHAIGRALSSAGYFGSEFASANESESYQKEKAEYEGKTATNSGEGTASKKQIEYIQKLCVQKGVDNSSWDFEKMSSTDASSKISDLMSQ